MEQNNEKITTVCISTCNRPEQLRSALSGLINNLEKYDRSPRILVIDDSENLQNAEKTKEICNSYAKNYPGKIECMDRDDRKEMASKIAKEKGIPEEVMNFALCGDKASAQTVGSSKNTFLLKTRGEKILTIDDDVVYRFFVPLKEDPPFFTIENPYEYWFLKDNEMPSTSLFKPVEVDLLGVHENMLGKKAGEILGQNISDDMKNMEIMDTYMGSYGDSPMASHIQLLFLPQVYEKLKNISEEKYKTMKETTRIIQTPLSQTTYQGIICISMIMGIDNRDLVLPFLPLGRGLDLVFGTTRSKAFPLKLSQYIPILIGHERPYREARSVVHNSVREMTKMSRIITSFINEMEDTDIDPRKNLQRIGDKFINVSEEPTPIFALMIEAQCKEITRAAANHIATILENSDGMPDFWINDMKSIIHELISPNPKFFMADITKNPSENNIAFLQKWMNLYGRMLKEWNKLQKSHKEYSQ